jgi:hypothetical protein
MRARWHRLLEAGDNFLQTAPFRYVNTLYLPVAPEQVWAALTADDTPWSPGARWSAVSVGRHRAPSAWAQPARSPCFDC